MRSRAAWSSPWPTGSCKSPYESDEPVDRRWLRVVKMRGADHLAGKHSFRITPGGCEVFPRLETIVSDQTPRRLRGCSQWNPAARRADGRRHSGGRRHRDPGTVGLRQDRAGAAFHRPGAGGRRALPLCLLPGERRPAHQKAASFGWDLSGPLDSGQLVIHHVPQGELNLDTLGAVVRKPALHRLRSAGGPRQPRRAGRGGA